MTELYIDPSSQARSLSPATLGWRAMWEEPGKTPPYHVADVAVWVLVEENGGWSVEGMVVGGFGLTRAEEEPRFLTYLAPDETPGRAYEEVKGGAQTKIEVGA